LGEQKEMKGRRIEEGKVGERKEKRGREI